VIKAVVSEPPRSATDSKLNELKVVHTNATSGVIDAPLDKVWAVFREFGKANTWWLDYFADMTVAPGTAEDPKLGQVRSFKTLTGTDYQEKLIELDEDRKRLSYSLEYMSTNMLDGAITTIDFDADPENAAKTLVSWSSRFTLVDAYAPLAEQITARQKQVYDLGIANLQRYFVPPGPGILKVAITGGSLPRDTKADYMTMTLGGGSGQRLSLSHCGTPSKKEELSFNIVSLDDNLFVQVVDRKLFADRLCGSAQVPLRSLLDSPNYTIQLIGKSGEPIGSFSLATEVNLSPAMAKKERAEQTATGIGKLMTALGKELHDNLMAIVSAMSDDINAKWEYANYGKEFGPLPPYCKVLPAGSAIQPKRAGYLFQRFTEYVYSQIPLLKVLTDPKIAAKVMGSDPFLLPFRGWMPKPEKVVERWETDEEVAAQLIRGVNPMKIEVVNDKGKLPEGLQDLSDDEGRSVDDLIKDKSLFMCDYYELQHGDYDKEGGFYTHQARLDALNRNVGTLKYWYAPILAVYKRKSGELAILGFQLTRFTDKPNKIYTKGSTPGEEYLLAKLHLTCADNQHHQFASHLGLTHLLVEPFAVGLHNSFPTDPNTGARHPIAALLAPHFHDTIGINFLARQTLVSEVAPFTDATFSTGTVNALKIFSTAYQDWTFFGGNFKNDLKRRGFSEDCSDQLDGFYYRDDGFLIWNALEKYVASVVDAFYSGGDSDVEKDPKLQDWCDEMRGPAQISSFPASFKDRATLVEACTSIIFSCSAQHAAVNFSQLRYVSYVPNRADALFKPMMHGAGLERKEVLKALPGVVNSEFQTLFSYLLTAEPDNPFSEYENPAIKKQFPDAWQGFVSDLEEIAARIEARNKDLLAKDQIPYEYLLPSKLPQSINI